VTEVTWVPLVELDQRLAYADERRLVRRALKLLRSGAVGTAGTEGAEQNTLPVDGAERA
jgi:hypothetical protein